MNLDWIIRESEDVYHAQSKCGRYMSSHMLADFRSSPLLYHKKITGQIEEKPSEALALGRAAHKLILEGWDEFENAYMISDGPVNEKTGNPYGESTNAYKSWLASQTKEVISFKNGGLIASFNNAVRENVTANEILKEGVAEGVVRSDYCGVPCQIRMDWFSVTHGLVDLKTCAELKYFVADAKRFGYIYQMAFYRAIIRAVTGVIVPVRMIAVEKAEPMAAGVWLIPPEVLDQAESVNIAALERYKHCKKNMKWPTGYEDERIIDSL